MPENGILRWQKFTIQSIKCAILGVDMKFSLKNYTYLNCLPIRNVENDEWNSK